MPGKEHDWEIVASREPFFGVVGFDDFRMSRIDEAARARFYATGDHDIARLLANFEFDVGARPKGGRALDLGCGVGRLTRAMAGIVDEVVGYDVAPSMLALAREVAPSNVSFTTEFPTQSFDWINSYIVFQHIPSKEGLALLDDCLAVAAPSAFLSLQFTGWRDGKQPSPASMVVRWLDRWKYRRPGQPADPLIRMYDYNFSDILKRLSSHGFERVVIRHTHHAGHHGAWFISRRAGANKYPNPS